MIIHQIDSELNKQNYQSIVSRISDKDTPWIRGDEFKGLGIKR